MIKVLSCKVRKLLKLFTPPILWSFLRKILNKNQKFKVFDGVFINFNEISESNYNSNYSLRKAFGEISDKLETYVNKSYVATNALSPISNLLPLVLATGFEEKKEKITILDYGGGMGDSYLECLYSLGKCHLDIEYHILDLDLTVKQGKKIFPKEMDIHFHTSFMDCPDNLDMIYVGSTLQYINNYQSLLNELICCSPKYIFFTDHFMGNAKTFATTQVNMKNRRMAYWIFNLVEIVSFLENKGYKNVYRSNNYQPFHNFDNFIRNKRVDDSCNLVFKKES
jgi:putative methyltransferase (TIGR04325 family)